MNAGEEALTRAWQNYYSSIEVGRRLMEDTPRFRDHPENRAAVYYTLAEAQAMAYNFAVAPRPDFPRVYVQTTWQTDLYTLGGNDASTYYASMFLDGNRTYRVTGRLGDVRIMTLHVASSLGGNPKYRFVDNREFVGSDMKGDRSFEIIFSATPRDDTWVRLDPESKYNWIIVRRQMADWFDDAGELRVELVGRPGTTNDNDPAQMAERIERAAEFFTYAIKVWNIGIYDYFKGLSDGRSNMVAFVSPKPGSTGTLGLSPSTDYASAIYAIEADEAIIIETEVPKSAAYWSFHLYDVWGKSIDFLHHQSDINMNRAVIDADDRFRAVISLEDPGVPNWLDPDGRREGLFIMRNYHGDSHPVPTLRLVKSADVRKYLPTGTPEITAEHRNQILNHRLRGLLRLWGK